MIDHQKVRREAIRWHLLQTLNVSRPDGMFMEAIKPVIESVYPDVTELELVRELDYLADRELTCTMRQPDGRWYADLTRHGVDVVEYTVECDPGISRPKK